MRRRAFRGERGRVRQTAGTGSAAPASLQRHHLLGQLLGLCSIACCVLGESCSLPEATILRGHHAAPLSPPQLPLRRTAARLPVLRALRGGGRVASPGKRALDSEQDGSDLVGDGTEQLLRGAAAASVRSAGGRLAKRMTVRGGNEDGAPEGEAAKASAERGEGEMDEALYSRQLYVFGHDAMRKMQQSNILLIGMAGLGVEIAKDLALAGVKSLTLHDPRDVRVDDLSAQFYCTEEHVGQNRAQVSLERLSSLNRHVEMKILEGPVNKSTIEQYSLVICSDSPFGECVMVNDACRAAGVKFIMTQARGLAGNIFVDLGDEFEVTDTNGENPMQAMISMVGREDKAKVVMLDEQRHGLEDGDFVTFAEVQGMTELNDLPEPVKVKVLGPYTLEIDVDTSKFGAYTGGGVVRQVKQPATVQFTSLRQCLQDPSFLTSDFAKIERERQLLLAFQAVDSFFVQLGAYPRPGVVEDADKVMMMARQFNTEIRTKDGVLVNAQLVDEIDEELIRSVAMQSRGQLAPMMSVLGSITAQEALKAISGKFMPIRQFFVYDALECLPGPGEDGARLGPEEFEGECSRYDGQIVCFGKTFQRKLEKLKYFLVGAGAIGCEMLKNWAMMGVGGCEEGVVHCTDMDVIEKSNLNRQFLFRPEDIQQLKSETACKRAKEMNPYMNVQTYSTKMGPDTEDLFDDDWFQQLDGVCNALDNVQARTYMDQRCVYLQKPLLESGTLGTKGNVQVVIPHITESYSSSRDPPEKAIPVCTLKNFPNAIEHTIQWARDNFEGVFKQSVDDAKTYLSSPDKFFEALEQQPTMAAGAVSSVKNLLVSQRPSGFRECLQWARERFQDLFHNQIHQLLFNFPLDMTDSQGQPFWAGAKRPPTPVDFDDSDQMHIDFIVAAATLRANNFGLPVPASVTPDDVRAVVSKMVIPEFAPKEGVKISTTDDDNAKGGGGGGEMSMGQMRAGMPPPEQVKGLELVSLDFDKDDDMHIEYVTACSNLRAVNYKITPSDKHNTKLIAGKIMPAIATTTSMVAGLVCLEMYKLVQGKPLDQFKNGFANLALPFFGFSEPIEAPSREYRGEKWNLWSRLDVKDSAVTLEGFLKHFKDKYDLELSMVSCGVSIVYSMFSSKAKERMQDKLVDIVKDAGIEIAEHQKYLRFEICANDREGEEVEAPSVRFSLS